MKCLICKNEKMRKGTTLLPIERGNAILLITDIPAQICTNCGEPYLKEDIAREVQQLANQRLAGEVSYENELGERDILVEAFA
ncbi:MAG: type II toxin-antitoxin system MqsA family antitoxin [Acidobacteria bacterium]|nr:type II toxin-antitoxin system MqsA family antitoxin [Acidobacteriota bacterium]